MKAKRSTITVLEYGMNAEILNGCAGIRPNKFKLITNTFMLDTGRHSFSEETVSDPSYFIARVMRTKKKKPSQTTTTTKPLNLF